MSSDIPLDQLAARAVTPPAELLPMPAKPDRAVIIAGSPEEVLARYRAGVSHYAPAVLSLSDEHLDTAFRPEAGVGRWSIRMVLGHLADAEGVLAHRFRRTVSEEGPVLVPWDFDSFIDAGLYDGPGAAASPDAGDASRPGRRSGQPVAAYLALIHAIRTATAEWLSLLPASAWSRSALHPQHGPLTLRELVGSCAWHLEHHSWYAEAKARRLAGMSILRLQERV
jgi:hypothetical protein